MNRNGKSILRIGIISLLGLVILSYTIFQAQKIIRGPIITVYAPENGATYSQALIEINGRARNVAFIKLDDRPIYTDKDGYFSEKLLLSPGYNIIKVSGEDKFKKSTEKKLEIILKEY